LIVTGAAILLAALVPASQPYRHAVAWRVPAEDQPFVDQALASGALAFGATPEEYIRVTRPRIDRDGFRTCVTLATHRSDGGGSYIGCYDNRNGSFLSDRIKGMPFGAERLWDRFGHWVW
jgi:hypothetical protein